MLKWFHALMPREERFFDMFQRHAGTLVAGAQSLRTLLDGGPGAGDASAAIMLHEHEADEIAREVMLAVRRTFITPFDRSDIKELISSLDDSIDQMQKTAKAIVLFEVTEFEPQMREMGDIIVKCAALTLDGVTQLSEMRRNAASLNAIAEKVRELEEQADNIHDQGLKALYLKCGKADAMSFIVGREIYSHLEKVVDRFEDVANRMSGILIEHL
jgi:predicted phosphate transport protein (TIGR00153 family)